MQIESTCDDIYIDLEIEQQDVYVDIGLEKSNVTITEQQAEILRGAQVHELSTWFTFEENDWEQLSQDSYRLIVSRETHGFNNPFVVEMQLDVSGGEYENNLRPTYRVSSSDNVIIYSDTAISCRIKIGGEK